MTQIEQVPDDNHLTDAEVALYVQALLENDIHRMGEVLLQHVEMCSDCKERILDVYLVLADRKQLSTLEHRRGADPIFSLGPEKRPFNVSLIAAVLVGCVILFALYRLVLTPPPISYKDIAKNNMPLNTDPGRKARAPKSNMRKKGDIIKQSSTQRVSRRYRVNANLEAMINSPTRSAVWEILSPVNDQVYESRLIFRWKKIFPQALTLKILNNMNQVIYSFEVTGREFLFIKPLPSGLYYWKLESSNDLLHVGRFRVIEDVIAPAR